MHNSPNRAHSQRPASAESDNRQIERKEANMSYIPRASLLSALGFITLVSEEQAYGAAEIELISGFCDLVAAVVLPLDIGFTTAKYYGAPPGSMVPPTNVLPTPPIHPSQNTFSMQASHYGFPSQPGSNDSFLSASHGYLPNAYPDFGQQLPTPPGQQIATLNQQLPNPSGQILGSHQYHPSAPSHISSHPFSFTPHPPGMPHYYPQHQLAPNHMPQSHDPTGQFPPPGMKPRVTTTLWEDEGTLCFQVEAKGVCVARREDNDMVNGTKLLNVAGMTRGRRDGILKSEKQRHVVKVGAMHLKGVWIPYDRALDFANKEKIVDLLYPLFVADIKTFLYHPSNYVRTAQVMAAAERRKQETLRLQQMQQGPHHEQDHRRSHSLQSPQQPMPQSVSSVGQPMPQPMSQAGQPVGQPMHPQSGPGPHHGPGMSLVQPKQESPIQSSVVHQLQHTQSLDHQSQPQHQVQQA
ncbi:uncharacterized protein V1510DRAFT_408387 [Dipodascopsis tothii]|uniref:uncharacterized protein n=1 Tax=Dipodascopsis tothii TaxID=44089 RepID=UPI0034CDD05B